MDVRRTTLMQQAAFTVVAIGWRSVQQRRRTGSSGVVIRRERGTAATGAGLLLAVGVAALAVGTVRQPARPWSPSGSIGAAAMLAGTGITLAAQQAMGASWRIGVDPDERTALVTTGPFRRVRNPIFSGMLLFAAGNALAVPNRLTVTGALHLAAGITAQVVLVEEPHLRRQHGDRYTHYAASSGRFLPRSTGRNPR